MVRVVPLQREQYVLLTQYTRSILTLQDTRSRTRTILTEGAYGGVYVVVLAMRMHLAIAHLQILQREAS